MGFLEWLMGFLEWLRKLFTPKPEYVIYEMPYLDMIKKLNEAGISYPLGVSDEVFRFTDIEGWKRILPHLLYTGHTSRIFNCEDIALKTVLRCQEEYGLNAIGMVNGWKNGKSHAFNLLYVKDYGFMLFEPQKNAGYGGVPFSVGDNDYKIYGVWI
jgi:hypothetical protein